MIRWIFAATASVALVGAGLVHGYWTDRWSASAEVSEAVERLASVPMRFGDWEGEDLEVKPGQVGAGVAGTLQRRFVHRPSGQAVVIALVNGRPGPVGTHTPEVCYGASGYNVGDKKAVALDAAGPGKFWTALALKQKQTHEERLRLYWAWNGGDGWAASKDPRGEFARFRYPVLHKLYVLRDLTAAAAVPGLRPEGKPGESRDAVCEAFLESFLPELDRALFSKPGG